MEEIVEIKGLVLASILFFMVPEATIVSQDVTEQRGQGRSGGLSTKVARAQCPRSVWRNLKESGKVPSMAMGREKET